MSAIPDSSLPGHKQLHDRVIYALDLYQESQDVDFKESSFWDIIKINITRTALAMANLRDGGIIIIGVSERDGKWTLEGVQQEHLKTYREDEINDFVNRFASPPLRLELVLVTHNGTQVLTIKVPEFERSPVICKRNGDDNIHKLREGAIYIRQVGKPETTQALKAEDVERLLELAAEKRAKAILLTAHRIGLTYSNVDKVALDNELGGL